MKFNYVVAMIVAFGFGCSKKKPAEKPAATPVSATAKDSTKDTASDGDGDAAALTRADDGSLKPTIYFEHDSSDLNEKAKTSLQENAEWLKGKDSREILIEGHTDETGTNEYNLGLGERRAQVARDYLVRLGVDAGRIKIITYGEEKPVSNENSENRRSMFISTKQ